MTPAEKPKPSAAGCSQDKMIRQQEIQVQPVKYQILGGSKKSGWD